jgi:hypothetical protein
LLSLLFAAGGRPSLDEAIALGEHTRAFSCSYAPDPSEGWFEALVTGLTFEVHGLAPAEPAPAQPIAHRYGLASAWWEPNLEAVTIQPGPHLAGGGAMLPVVRGAIDLAIALATAKQVAAVVWLPARSAMAVEYFTVAGNAWLGGGAFPAPGLIALVDSLEGGISSQGLAFFIGQEVEAAPWPGAGKADVARCVGARPLSCSSSTGASMPPPVCRVLTDPRCCSSPVAGSRRVRVRAPNLNERVPAAAAFPRGQPPGEAG